MSVKLPMSFQVLYWHLDKYVRHIGDAGKGHTASHGGS